MAVCAKLCIFVVVFWCAFAFVSTFLECRLFDQLVDDLVSVDAQREESCGCPTDLFWLSGLDRIASKHVLAPRDVYMCCA